MFSLTIEMKTGSNWNNGNIGEWKRMEWFMRCDPVYLNSIDLDLNLSLKSMTGTSPLSIGNWKWFITPQTESSPGIVRGKLRKNLHHFLAWKQKKMNKEHDFGCHNNTPYCLWLLWFDVRSYWTLCHCSASRFHNRKGCRENQSLTLGTC